ncbi:MAG: DUF1572 domain-containing protein [Acidobacteria bacterium]|nr:DUF1572 domain-containing protein [Acidobacteriota bacterium]
MMPQEQEIGREFLRVSRRELRSSLAKIEKALAKLSDEQIWARGRETENSIGNLLLHLSGNVRQWIVAGVGGGKDHRDRDAEFAQRDAIPAAELLEKLRATLDDADRALEGVEPAALLATHRIQGYEVTGLRAIYHCVEHFGGHTGQILWAVKHATGEDLGFYRYLQGGGTAPPERREP